MINVGIIASGFIVPEFINAVNAIGGYKLRAIFVRPTSLEKANALKEQYGFDYVTTDLEEFMSDEEMDAIYVASPNASHYEYAKKGLEHNKHIIVEKPFVSYAWQAEELFKLANERELIIFEANVIQYLPNYQKIKELKDKVGDIKLVSCNFSQYSSRYDRFKQGIIMPVFDPKHEGGALMDLGVYNIHFVTGIFGAPERIEYRANIEKGVDTAGVLILSYPTFKASLICAKNCKAPAHTTIQGDEAYINSNEASSRINKVEFVPNKADAEIYELNTEANHYAYEYNEFKRLVKEKDLETNKIYNAQTLLVVKVLEEARKSAGLSY